MSDHEAFERSAQEKLVAESGHSKNVEEEKELLRGQVAELRKVCRFFVELSITYLFKFCMSCGQAGFY